MTRWLLAIIALAATVASAGRVTTFAWENGTDWPAGTTVELCSNGVCAAGLTGTQYTLDVPINQGEKYDAKARAVAPAGYQCGNPLQLCPHSEWFVLKQTWPVIPEWAWATKKETVNTMSIVIDSTDDRFERTSGYINHNQPYTIMAWVKINTDRNDYGHFIAITSGTWGVYQTSDWIGTDFNGTTLRIGSYNSSGSAALGSNLNVGTWYHIALVRESATSLVGYLNAVLNTTSVTTDVTSRSATQREVYGVMYDASYSQFVSIAAIKAWQTALTATEIAAERNQYDPVRSSNLVHYTPAYTGSLSEQLTATTGASLTQFGTPTTDASGPSITAPGGSPAGAALPRRAIGGPFYGATMGSVR